MLPPGWTIPVLLIIVLGAATLTIVDLLPIAVGGLAVLVCALIARGRPIAVATLYAAVIPIENVVVVAGGDTVGRIIALALVAGYVARRRSLPSFRFMPAWGWAFVGWAILSLAWSVDIPTTYRGLVTLVQLFVLSLVLVDIVARQPAAVRPILAGYAVTATFSALLAIGTFAVNRESLIAGRAEGFPGQDSALFTAVQIPALLFMFREALQRRPWAIPALLGVLATSVAILLSGTRSAWLALAVALVIGLLPVLRPKARLWAIAVPLLIVLATLQVPAVNQLVIGRAERAVDSGGEGRTEIWSVGLTILAGAPAPLGVGYGAFPSAFTRDQIIATDNDPKSAGVLRPGLGPHSILVGTLVQTGLVGVLLLALFIGVTLIRLLAAAARDPATSIGRLGDARLVFVILLGMTVQAFFLDVFERKQVWLVLALGIGLIAAETRLAREGPRSAARPRAPGP